MSLDRDMALLRSVPLFNALNEDQLRLLAFGSVRRHFVAGAALFEQGSPAASGLVVASGAIRLSVSGEGGTLKESLELCKPGMLIGELALFVETSRRATATAERRTEVVEITRSLMIRLLEEYPQLALHFRARLAGRLSGSIADMERIRQALLVDAPKRTQLSEAG